MKGAGFCSLYREIRYIELRYNKVIRQGGFQILRKHIFRDFRPPPPLIKVLVL